ncbi:MAG: hypothetical protein HUK08_02880 [Bacteroidaceae bacterium]|nr:hypothetical protein [Bacteroidaceae bacterium]
MANVVTTGIQEPLPGKKGISEETRGFIYAIVSSLCYTVSLSMLRGLTNYPDVSSDWSIAIKELTTVAFTLPFIVIQSLRGRYRFPCLKAIFLLILSGVVCQALGARYHLFAYAALGLALTTPLLQAVQMIMTSLVGAVWLKERVTKVKIATLALLIFAVWLLSGGSSTLEATIAGKELRLGFGLFCVVLASLGYTWELSILRRLLRVAKTTRQEEEAAGIKNEFLPTSLGMIAVTGVGAIICGAALAMQNGLTGLDAILSGMKVVAEDGSVTWTAPPTTCWILVLIAGVANMTGFYFQIEGLRRLFVLKQTMLANAQAIALTLTGFVFYHETCTWTIGLGVVLVAVGVAVAGLDRDKPDGK